MTTSLPSYSFITSSEMFTSSPKHVRPRHPAKPVEFINMKTPLLSHLDPLNTGTIPSWSLIQYWSELGIPDAKQSLREIGISAEQECLDLKNVSNLLNDEINQSIEYLNYPSSQAALVTLYNEVI